MVRPAGNVRIGDLWPTVPVNSVVGDVKGLNNIPIRSQGTQTIFIRDVGSVKRQRNVKKARQSTETVDKLVDNRSVRSSNIRWISSFFNMSKN